MSAWWWHSVSASAPADGLPRPRSVSAEPHPPSEPRPLNGVTHARRTRGTSGACLWIRQRESAFDASNTCVTTLQNTQGEQEEMMDEYIIIERPCKAHGDSADPVSPWFSYKHWPVRACYSSSSTARHESTMARAPPAIEIGYHSDSIITSRDSVQDRWFLPLIRSGASPAPEASWANRGGHQAASSQSVGIQRLGV